MHRLIRGTLRRVPLLPISIIVLLGLIVVAGRWTQPPPTQLAEGMGETEKLPWFAPGTTRFKRVEKALRRVDSDVPEPVALSLEPPSGYTATNEGGRLIFAHVADGSFQFEGSRRFMQTTLTLINDSAYDATGTLSFFKASGEPWTPGVPMRLTVDGVTASQFTVEVPARSTKRLVTAGTGDVQSGWAELRSDQPLVGASSFSTRDGAGTFFSDVGVEESVLGREFTVFADSKGGANTGIALVNPSATREIWVSVELRRADGTFRVGMSIVLPPRHHSAQFLPEMFPGTAGIDDFEGTVFLQSEDPFAGITLRTMGALLTSVPMVTPANPREERRRLTFPQIADGADGGIRIVTTVVLFNNTESRVTGELKFVQADGNPMNVAVGTQTASSFTFGLNPGGVARFLTRGTGAIKTGWADVVMDGPASGAAIYHILDQQGRALTEVGVRAATRFENVTVIADSPGVYRTAVALANVGHVWERATLELYDAAGRRRASERVELDAFTQRAVFLDELFGEVAGIENWQGWVAVDTQVQTASGERRQRTIVALTLRQAGLLTTSVPTVLPVRGFKPASVMEPAQRLTNSSPAVRWRVEQLRYDLAMDRVELSAPGLGLRAEQVRAGDELGYGYFLANRGSRSEGGIAKLICTETNPLTFDLVVSMEGLLDWEGSIVLMSGRLEGQASSGFKWTLGPTGAPPLDWNPDAGMELDLTLRDGLVRTPAAAGTTQVTSRVWSVSTKRDGVDVRIERTCRHPVAFQARPTDAPFLESSRPIFLSPGGRLVLRGGGFGGQPAAVFPTLEGETEDYFPEVVSQAELEAFAPGEAVGGEVAVRNGGNLGNALVVRSLFAPVVEVRTVDASPAGAFSIEMDWAQAGRELGPAGFEIRLLGVAWPAAQGGAGAILGNMIFRGGAWRDDVEEYEVGLESSAANLLRLFVRDDWEDSIGRIEVRPIDAEEGTGGVVLAYAPLEGQEQPTVHGHPLEIELSIPGLVFPPPPADETPLWTVEARSLPADLMGSETALTATQSIRVLR